jgi:hypothetical protein
MADQMRIGLPNWWATSDIDKARWVLGDVACLGSSRDARDTGCVDETKARLANGYNPAPVTAIT